MNKAEKTKNYIYLADTASLDVVRFDRENKAIYTIVEDLLKKGYLVTRPEIYRRFKEGVLTEASFVEVERRGIKRKANIIYN